MKDEKYVEDFKRQSDFCKDLMERLDRTIQSAEDPVNHPKHYADTCSLECIDVMLIAFGKDAVISFCMCNAFKYMWRFKNKNGQEDLQKAKWYLNKAEDLGPDDYLHDQILCLCATIGRLNRGEK